MVKNLPAVRKAQVWCLGWEDPWRRKWQPSSTLAWKIQWTEEPEGLQSMGSQRIGHDWADWATNIHLIRTLLKMEWKTPTGIQRGEEMGREEMLKSPVSAAQEPRAGQGEAPWHPPGCLRCCSRCPWRLGVLSVPPGFTSADWKKWKGVYIRKTEEGLGLLCLLISPNLKTRWWGVFISRVTSWKTAFEGFSFAKCHPAVFPSTGWCLTPTHGWQTLLKDKFVTESLT